MIKSGYALVDKNGNVVEELPYVGSTPDGRPILTVRYENGGPDNLVAVMSPKVGATLPGSFRVLERFRDDPGAPSPFHSSRTVTAIENGAVVTRLVYADSPDLVPESVTMAQCRLALNQIGRLAEADAAVQASGNDRLKILWEYASDVRRDAPELLAMAEGMKLTAAEVDDLFRLAKSL